MDRLIPYIEIDKENLPYIIENLSIFGYKIKRTEIDDNYLVIDSMGELGNVSTYTRIIKYPCRILINDVEEFLNMAAKLAGYHREFKMENLKSGMVVRYNKSLYLVIDAIYGLCIVNQDSRCYLHYCNFDNITEVYDRTSPDFAMTISTENRNCIYRKNVELTMQEIADAFNIHVEQLKIKK